MILFGGTAVDGVMGQELLKAFSFVDLVSQGDADWRIVQIVEALLNRSAIDHIPGVLSRCNGCIVDTVDAVPAEDLNDLPLDPSGREYKIECLFPPGRLPVAVPAVFPLGQIRAPT